MPSTRLGAHSVVLGKLRLDCLIDVSVDAVGSKGCHHPVGVEDVKNLRLDVGPVGASTPSVFATS